MRIKLDENLPYRLVKALGALGHEAHTVKEEGLTGQPDSEVWAAAQRERAFLVTQDLDFSDLRRYAPGTHAGILLVRLRDPGRNSLFERLNVLFQTEDTAHWRGCLVVVTDHKLRVRRRKEH